MRQTTAEVVVEEYRPLVRRIARHLKRRVQHRAEIDDLMQAGMEGLIEAAPRYNPESGASFDTFVGWRIRGAMVDALREGDWAPRQIAQSARKIADAIRAIEVQAQRPARETEIAERLGISLAEYRVLLQDTSAHHVFSIEDTPQAFDAVTHSDPAREVAEEEMDDAVRAAIATLPERERYIIEQTLCGLTLREVGHALGITESRVCQLRTQAVARLRAALFA